jgi:acetylornithine deacetylase/succinyl-diaminopimelate desuccinylase-like protein
LRRVIGDARVEAIPLAEPSRPAAPPSRLDTEMYRALEAVGRRMFGAPTIPAMLTGATDNAQLRARGVQAYGVGELVSVEDGPLGGAHSDDERLSVRSLETMTEFLWNAVLEVAAR